MNYDFQFEIDKPRETILNTIRHKKENYKWLDALSENIDYREFTISQTSIEVNRSPKVFSAFRALGKIKIDIEAKAEKISLLTIRVLPFNGAYPYILIGLSVFLSMWTVGFLLMKRDTATVIAIVIAWTTFSLVLYLQYRYYKWALKEYAQEIINEIRKDKKPRR